MVKRNLGDNAMLCDGSGRARCPHRAASHTGAWTRSARSPFRALRSGLSAIATLGSSGILKYAACVLIAAFAIGEAGAGTAPVNPNFKKWIRKQQMKSDINVLRKKQALKSVNVSSNFEYLTPDLMPSYMDMTYLSRLNNNKLINAAGDNFKERYDLRNSKFLTPIKDQDPYGTCWAHAAMGSLEACCLSNLGIEYDFSENNLANLHGFKTDYLIGNYGKGGGFNEWSQAYFLRWDGPVLEKDDPYENGPETSSLMRPAGHVQQIRWIPLRNSYLDNDLIKKAVAELGPVSVSYFHYHYAPYYNASKASFYYDGSYYDGTIYEGSDISDNHQVVIVGWDDKYSKANFCIQPPGDGAFIVRNSWGVGWGDGGYFYVSYYDKNFGFSPVQRLLMFVFPNLESVDNYANIYQYDSLGDTTHFGSKSEEFWGANVFTAERKEQIAAVGFYALVPNTAYQLSIYVGCNNGPISGTRKLEMSGITDGEFAGYFTVPLTSLVDIEKGQKFSIVLKLTTKGYGYPLAMECLGYYSDTATASSGQSFYSFYGDSWVDLTTYDSSANFCFKAYTKSATAPTKQLSSIVITGVNSLQSGKTAQFTCKAKYSDGSEADITKTASWSIASGSAYASVDSTGLVTAKNVTQQQTVKVHAEYTEGGVTKNADWTSNVTVAPPEPPTNVAASQGTDASCVRVTWTASPGASSYSVYRSKTASYLNAEYLLPDVTVPKFNDNDAEPGVKYYYFIKAKNASGVKKDNAFSAGAQGWKALSAPEGVTASDGTSLEYVEITWTAAPGAKYYRVYRSDDIDGEKSPLGSWQSETTYRDATATPGKVYCYYVVSAIDSRGNMASDYSIFDDGYIGVPVTLDYITIDGPATIASGGNATYTCTATYTDKSTRPVARPSWSIIAGGDYASVDSSGKVTAKTVSSNQSVTLQASYTDGVNRKATKTIVITATTPSAPSSVTLKSATTEAVTINWSSVAGAAGYSVWRGSTTTDAKKIADVGTATEYADKSGTPGVSYKYWVKASNAAGESGFSAMSVTAMRGLSAPTGVVASDGTYTDKTLITWKPVTGATHYRVARAGSTTGSKTDLGSWQTGTSYEDKSGTAGTHYWYFVRAATSSSGANASAYSACDEGWRPVVVTLSSIEISGAAKLAAGGSTVLSCTAKYSNNSTKTVKPEWSVSPTTAATIDADGKLTAKRVTENVTVTVTARFTDGTTKTDTYEVLIVAPIVATAEVKNVQAKTRWPFSNFLDVDYELVTHPAGTRALVTLSGRDDDKGVAMAARSLTGDGATGPVEAGKHRLTWDVAADYPDFHTKAFSVEMSAVAMSANMPSNVTASAGTSTAGVNIGWAKIDDATGYEVWRNTSSVTNGAKRIQTTDQVAYTDTDAAAGTTYWYWVRSITPDGTSDFGKPVSGWRAYADITVTFNPNGGSVSPTSKPYSPTKAYGTLPTATRTGYDFDGWYTASNGGTKVTTASTVPTSAHTLWAQWTKKPIYTPSNVSASDGSSTAGVTISWSSTTGANSYKIYRYTSNNSSSASSIGTTSSTSYSDMTATAGTVYYYWVKALNTDNDQESSLSSCDTGYRKLSAPTGVSASDGKYADKVTVSWSVVSGANTYYVYRNTSNNSGSASLLGTTSSTGYTDSSIALGTTYYYWVKAYANSSSSYSDMSSADAGYPLKALVSIEIIGPDSLDAGSNVTYKCIATYSDGAKADVTPTWAITSGSSYATISSAGVFTAKDSLVDRSVTIKAEFTNNGTASTTKAITIYGVIPLATALDNSSLTFVTGGDANWLGVADVSYDGTDAARSGTIKANQSSWLSTTVTGPGTLTFRWKVSSETGCDKLTFAIDGTVKDTISGTSMSSFAEKSCTLESGEHSIKWVYSKDGSANSGSDCGWVDKVEYALITKPNPPSGVTATQGTSSDRISLNWSAVTGATSYEVWRSTSTSSSTATRIDTVATPGYADTSAVAGTTYYYWITAVNLAGASTVSTRISGYRLKIPTCLTINGDASVRAGGSATYTATATYNDGSTQTVTPTWSLSSGSSYGSINSSGVFTAIGTATQRSVTVAASYTENGATVSTAKGVTITTFTVTITFNGNGGYAIGREKITYTAYGTYDSLPSAYFHHYNFMGWFTATNGDTQVTTSSTVPAASMSLYARWTAIAPDVPTNVSATDGTYSDKVTISWTWKGNLPDRFYIYRSTTNDCSSAILLSDTMGVNMSYIDKEAIVGTTYYYWVKAYFIDNGLYGEFSSSDAGYATIVNPTKLYLVVDLSAGPDAVGYPMSELNDVPGGSWTDDYKTNKLVLRRIANGSFMMGSPMDEVGRNSNEDQHQVTISKAFYMGVFQVTQKQYELVLGSKPSYFSNASCYATRPVERVSYNTIRGSSDGAKWPSANSVDGSSFMGKIRAKTGLTFDLPTEAQWEYACRAGMTTALNSGKNLTSTSSDSNMNEVGRYYYNSPCGSTSYSSSSELTAGTAAVGSYKANNWGLYDMHGNVWEWCLDCYQSSLGTSAATDPKGGASGSFRVMRGGSWGSYAHDCRSASRDLNAPADGSDSSLGFRLCCPAGLVTDQVTVSFNANCGMGTMPSVTVGCGGSMTIPKNEFRRDGYDFEGWKESGVVYADEGTIPSVNYTRTLEAIWVPILPDAPTNISATDGTNTDGVRVTWNAVEGATRYDIYRANSNSNNLSKLIGTTTSTMFMDVTPMRDAIYYYWVKAYRSDNNQFSQFSASDSGFWTFPAPTLSSNYVVINLSGGSNTNRYAESQMASVPSGGWTDEYKTTKLVLRRIANGSFTMGSSVDEIGRERDEYEHQVTISKSFYIGVFEVTQKQYQLVMGKNPSEHLGDARPVEHVSYPNIRGSSEGAQWPNTNTVDATSFLGVIRARTGIIFDLPTEAQWEYACRAGTTTALNNGKNLANEERDLAMDEVGRYGCNSGKDGMTDGKGGYDEYHTVVGSYIPNNWGLYDMHGNVEEWCLDWYISQLSGPVTDPRGYSWVNPANRTDHRVLRGGNHQVSAAKYCRSARRIDRYLGSKSDIIGFRLCCPAGLQGSLP